MDLRARKVSGAFEKRAPVLEDPFRQGFSGRKILKLYLPIDPFYQYGALLWGCSGGKLLLFVPEAAPNSYWKQ